MDGSSIEPPRPKLSPDSIWPPLKTTATQGQSELRQQPILVEQARLRTVHSLLAHKLACWTDGFQKSLLIDPSSSDPVSVPEYQAEGELNVEAIKDDPEARLRVELITKAGPAYVVVIDQNGVIYTDETTAAQVDPIIRNLFDVTGKEAKYKPKVVGGATRNLKMFRNKSTPQPEGSELDDYASPKSKKTAIEALRDEVRTAYKEAPAIEGIDRKRIIEDALSAAVEHTRGKIGPEQQVLLDSLLSNHHILFLKKDDYDILLQAWGNEKINWSTAAMTYFNGVIAINQDEITELASRNFERFKLLRRKENTPMTPASTTEALQLFTNYIEYHCGVTDKPIEPNVPAIDDRQAIKELTENLIWSFAFHEGLHVAAGNGHFLEGLSEAATHYYTAVASLQRKGINALGAYLTFSDLEKAIEWTSFLRDLPITEDVAEQMYYNKTGEWTMSKMFEYFGKENEKGFYNILTTGRVVKDET